MSDSVYCRVGVAPSNSGDSTQVKQMRWEKAGRAVIVQSLVSARCDSTACYVPVVSFSSFFSCPDTTSLFWFTLSTFMVSATAGKRRSAGLAVRWAAEGPDISLRWRPNTGGSDWMTHVHKQAAVVIGYKLKFKKMSLKNLSLRQLFKIFKLNVLQKIGQLKLSLNSL